MKNIFKMTAIAAMVVASSACTRIETGEVGVRVNMSKEIEQGELSAGSWNQTVIGDVLTFPVKDITVSVLDKTPLTEDNSALEDFDVTLVYSINPQSVADLWSKKAKSFHTYYNGDWYLMYDYMSLLTNNAMYQEARKYKALEINDKRQDIEKGILAEIRSKLAAEGLDKHIILTAVQVRNIKPNREILASATAYVKAQNELKVKATEVEIAKKESERMAALAANSTQSIAFMNAQAQLKVAEGVANGKVHTVVVPYDFKGIVNAK
jgi:regulator of protease activity HflC (stomatin/prohibitin superfamily)